MKTLVLIPMIALSLIVAGCDDVQQTTARQEMDRTDQNQANLIAKIPAPQLDDSLERRNLVERLQRLNRANLNGYIYLINFGKIMAYYPVKGKVTSLNAYLSPSQQVIRWPDGSADKFLVDSPDFDGAYGQNDDGIFFFTTNGAYVEWNGDYLWSDQPLQLTQQPELIVNLTK